MLQISSASVSAFSLAIYSRGKVCRSVLQANPSLSSYISKNQSQRVKPGLDLKEQQTLRFYSVAYNFTAELSARPSKFSQGLKTE